MKYDRLIESAINAAKCAYSPYSGFRVGAALLCEDGAVYEGCNIENASFGATCCAERIAIFGAVKAGKRSFKSICIVGYKDDLICEYCYPCGICRQVMAEFCAGDFEIVLFNGTNEKILKLNELLPYSFSGDIL